MLSFNLGECFCSAVPWIYVQHNQTRTVTGYTDSHLRIRRKPPFDGHCVSCRVEVAVRCQAVWVFSWRLAVIALRATATNMYAG